MRQGLLIELIDPLITSASIATEAVPEALPYIPGAMLLGAAAAKGYASGLPQQEASRLFHSGSVKFGDGLPIDTKGQIGLPNPVSLHFPKGADPFDRDKLVDFSGAERLIAHEQLRGKALSADCLHIPVKTSATMRTAIDRGTGRAAESQLFGYKMLDAGQFFLASIDANSQEDMDNILAYLTPGDLFLGRSKSGEFGRVRITFSNLPEFDSGGEIKGDTYLWCLSDLWAHDANGVPTLAPDASFFGSSGVVDWSRSFTRNRMFSPYNAKWQSRGAERALIQRGAVFVIKDGSMKTGSTHFGMGLELGYGHVLVSDCSPKETLAALSAFSITLPIGATSPPPEQTKFLDWLAGRSQGEGLDASKYLDTLIKHYEAAKHIAGYPVGPGPSQWGSLKTILQRGEEVDSFLNSTRGESKRRQWGAIYASGDNNTFTDFIKTVICERDTETAALLAREIRNWLEKEGWFDGK